MMIMKLSSYLIFGFLLLWPLTTTTATFSLGLLAQLARDVIHLPIAGSVNEILFSFQKKRRNISLLITHYY